MSIQEYPIRVIALDIDGTLTNSSKEITPRTKEAIWEAANRGVKIVIASGRPVAGLSHYEKELELERIGGYLLALNGGAIIDCAKKQVLVQHMIPMEYYNEICELAWEQKVHLMTYEKNVIISETLDDPYLNLTGRNNNLKGQRVEDLKTYLTFPVPKFLMLGEGEYLAKVEKTVWERLHERLEVYRSEPYFLEILPKDVNKAKGLENLLEHLHMQRENLMAFGDGYNDQTMLSYAGLGVAMANAVSETKAVADYITLSNDDDGIADAIHKFILD